MNSILKKNKNKNYNHGNFHYYHTFRSAAAAAQPFRVSPGRSMLGQRSEKRPTRNQEQEQRYEKYNPGSLSVSAPASSLLEMNAMRLPFAIHSWGGFPGRWTLPRETCSIHAIPVGSLPWPAVSHQLLLSLRRCRRQGHPLPLHLCVAAGSCYSHERLLVVVCRGWEAHWTQHSGSHQMVTKPSIWTARKKKKRKH